jgi:cytochrome c553
MVGGHFSCPLLVRSAEAQSADKPTAKQLEFFEKKIRPVLSEKCYSCHSADAEKIKGGLLLDSREATLRGGDTGPALVPGDAAASMLVEMIHWQDPDLAMPPKDKLSDQQIADFETWIAMGAPDPRAEKSAADGGTLQIVSDIDFEEGRKFWAFQPPTKTPAPSLEAVPSSWRNWPATDIDRFVAAGLAEAGLEPVAAAEPVALVRRLYFDLIGLPPNPQQVDAFLAAEKSDRAAAVSKLVDDLLASPHFGERWGRHWLDVARYAESNGMERNFTYPQAWRYRDYVIASFNEDKPFDQFAREQIAGDLLTGPPERADERKTATGFLALGPKMLNERDKEVFRYELADEQIDAVSRAFIGLTVSCARCHDHKFDPVSTRDYYALAGIFTSSNTLFGTANGGGNRQASPLMPIGEQATAKQEEVDAFKKRIANLNKKLKAAQARQKAAQKRLATQEKINKPNPAQTKQLQTTRQQMATVKKAVKAIADEIAQMRKNQPEGPQMVMGVVDRPQPADSPLLKRGNVDTKGKAVPRGFLTVFHGGDSPKPLARPEGSGRLELAHWVGSPHHPLTARVAANRTWSHLFGRGLVATPDNFGHSGERPDHPELLDHLAVRLVELDWSTKALIREIVVSHSYQLSTEHHEKNHQTDPDNRLAWRQNLRRLDAESLRDALLAVSGKLELSPAHASVVHEMGDENFGRSAKLQQLLRDGIASPHRSVYMPVIRNAVPAALSVFDFAEPSLIVGKRNETTVPAQALFLLNNKFMLNRSADLAENVLAVANLDDSQRISYAWRMALARPATDEEAAAALAFLKSSGDKGLDKQQAWAALCQALLASAEFRYLN